MSQMTRNGKCTLKGSTSPIEENVLMRSHKNVISYTYVLFM